MQSAYLSKQRNQAEPRTRQREEPCNKNEDQESVK